MQSILRVHLLNQNARIFTRSHREDGRANPKPDVALHAQSNRLHSHTFPAPSPELSAIQNENARPGSRTRRA